MAKAKVGKKVNVGGWAKRRLVSFNNNRKYLEHQHSNFFFLSLSRGGAGRGYQE